MPARIYLPSTGSAPVSPAMDGGWATAPPDRRALVRARISSAMTQFGYLDQGDAANTKSGIMQFVGPGMHAQTISGTVKGQVRACEEATADNYDRVVVGIRVCSNNGSTFRGTILTLGMYVTANEFSLCITNKTNRKIADGDSLSSLAIQDGDRLVIELGVTTAGSLGFDGGENLTFGDDSGTDLAEDETTTSAHNPWIEFSQDIFTNSVSQTAIAIGVTVPTPSVAVSLPAVDIGVGVMPEAVKVGLQPVAIEVEVVRPQQFDAPGYYDPTAVVTMSAGVDPFIIHASGTLGDLSDTTGVTSITPASWPTGTGTRLASQNIIGKNLPDWPIVQLVFGARGVMTQDGSYLSNHRIDLSGHTYALVNGAWDDIRPYTVGASSYVDRCRNITSAPVTTNPATGLPWVWSDLLAIPSATVKVDNSNITTVGHFAEIYVTEMYIEAYGMVGSLVTPLRLRFKAGPFALQLPTSPTFGS